MEVISGTKIGPLEIGMTYNQVRELFNEPTIYEEWMGGNLNDCILAQGLLLGFDECDSQKPLPNAKFTWFEMRHRENGILFGKNVVDWNWTEFKEYIVKNQMRYEFLKQNDNETEIKIPEKGLNVSFENNIFQFVGSYA